MDTDRTVRAALRCLLLAASLALAGVLGGCASALPTIDRTLSFALPPRPDSPVARLVEAAALPADVSGFWPVPQGAFALDARLALLREARHSIDVQTYLLGDDGVGRTVMRALRDAAARGVRVRLLLDDLYTAPIETDLLALQSFPGVEVRLFNPFTLGRRSFGWRLVNFAGDFDRLNRRMHNKLLVVDGALAVVGGRNLADEYFLRSPVANFFDIDVLAAGKLVPELAAEFDTYWNSEFVYPLAAIDRAAVPAADLQRAFAARVDDPVRTPPIAPLVENDALGAPPFGRALREGRQRFVPARAQVVADPPWKASPDPASRPAYATTVTARYLEALKGAQREILIVSPYFVPGRQGVERLAEARARGVEVRVLTNATGTSDEPLVNAGYGRYREELLRLGVRLDELSAARTDADAALKKVLGRSHGRLHAKMSFIDRRILLVGSMNVDLRSAFSNTEIGVGIDSPEIAAMILEVYRADTFPGVYTVRLRPDGRGVQWVGRGDAGEQVVVEEPDVSPWQHLKLWLQFLFVPEDLL